MKTSITQRENAIKEHVVEMLGYRDTQSNLFQVWQPHHRVWIASMEQRILDSKPGACLSEYLEFPHQYCLAALVVGESLTDVSFIMKNLDDSDENFKVTFLAQFVWPSTVGDVIVTPEGVPMFVTDTDYLALPSKLLS